MTYKVAICDDEIVTCENLERQIQKAINNHSLRAEIDVFYSGEALIKHMTEGAMYHFVFLDIELYELSGVEVSRYIRERIKDVMCQIVFISSKTSYAMELFRFQPLDFLIKPISETELEEDIIRGLKIIGIVTDSFDCISGKTVIRTPISKILYFESDGRKIKLVTSDDEIVFYDRMSRIMEKLPPAFIRTHKSFIVNINAIRQCRYDCVILYDDIVIPISRSYRNDVRDKLVKTVGDR